MLIDQIPLWCILSINLCMFIDDIIQFSLTLRISGPDFYINLSGLIFLNFICFCYFLVRFFIDIFNIGDKDVMINLFDIKNINLFFIYIYLLAFDFQFQIFSRLFSFFQSLHYTDEQPYQNGENDFRDEVASIFYRYTRPPAANQVHPENNNLGGYQAINDGDQELGN